MKLKELLTETFTLTESNIMLLNESHDTLSEKQLTEKYELVKDMLHAAFGIDRKYITELSTRQGYNITLSHMCQGIKASVNCLKDFRDKLLSSKMFATFNVRLIDDIIEMIPIKASI